MLYTYIRNWLKAQEGQDLIEYALLIALLVAVAAVGMGAVGQQISGFWVTISNWLGNVPSTLPTP